MALATPDNQRSDKPEAKMDATNLYREDVVTDRRVGTLRMMTPIKSDGSVDAAREPIFVGEAQIMTNAGPLPINFEIEAKTLADAVAQFGESAAQGVHLVVMRALRERVCLLLQGCIPWRTCQQDGPTIRRGCDCTRAHVLRSRRSHAASLLVE